MTAPPLAYESMQAGAYREWTMRIGEAEAPPVLFVPPLFEELNRTRALIAAAMRALAARGYGCWLPDLPGTGESERDLGKIDWETWRHGVESAARNVARAAGRAPLVASLRGGALLDDAADAAARWRLSPITGAAVVREMERSGLAGGVAWAGYAPPEALIAALRATVPQAASPLRTVRLEGDPGEADARLEGPALWRRSEPGRSAALAEAMAADIDTWARSCGAC